MSFLFLALLLERALGSTVAIAKIREARFCCGSGVRPLLALGARVFPMGA